MDEKTNENSDGKTEQFDYDGYYKDLIQCFFYSLLKRAIPELYEAADVSVESKFLDKELRNLPDKGDPEFHTNPHFADCIAEVPTKDGKKTGRCVEMLETLFNML